MLIRLYRRNSLLITVTVVVTDIEEVITTLAAVVIVVTDIEEFITTLVVFVVEVARNRIHYRLFFKILVINYNYLLHAY